MEEHSDVHEFVPWAHFGEARTRYVGPLVAVVAVLAVGLAVFSLSTRAPDAAPITAIVPEVMPIEVAPVLLSERDLLAVDVSSARMIAEEFVVGYFTRSGADPSYVEWARAGSIQQGEVISVSVRYSLLSGEPMTRQLVRESLVHLERAGGTWRVLGLPIDREAPAIEHVVTEAGVDNEFGFSVGSEP